MTSFWEILKSSKSLKASDAFAELWGKSIADRWDIITITGSLPLSFLSKGKALTNYRLYGTSEGAGVQTSGTEPAGYKIPLTVTSGSQSQDYPLYIGSTQLMAEEYVDYGEQKVYKRTDNDFPFAEKGTFAFGDDGYIISDGEGKFTVSPPSETSASASSELIPLNKPYTIPQSLDTGGEFVFYLGNNAERYSLLFVIYDADRVQIDYWRCLPRWRINTNYTQMAGKTIAYIGVRGVANGDTEITPMFSKTSDLTSYIPYLQPTDPPVSFPAITAYQSENTLSSTETVGEVSVTGKIKEI